MSKRGAEAILNARMEETRRQKEAEAAEAEARKSYVIEPTEPAGPSRTTRAFDRVNAVQRSDPSTGLGDPRLAPWLYLAVVTSAAMFSIKGGKVMAAIVSGVRK